MANLGFGLPSPKYSQRDDGTLFRSPRGTTEPGTNPE